MNKKLLTIETIVVAGAITFAVALRISNKTFYATKAEENNYQLVITSDNVEDNPKDNIHIGYVKTSNGNNVKLYCSQGFNYEGYLTTFNSSGDGITIETKFKNIVSVCINTETTLNATRIFLSNDTNVYPTEYVYAISGTAVSLETLDHSEDKNLLIWSNDDCTINSIVINYTC